MKKSTACSVSRYLSHEPGESNSARAYRLVAVMTAQWLLKRRRPFLADDVKLRRLPGVQHRIQRMYVGEFLGAWDRPDAEGGSFLAQQMLRACPTLHAKVKKFWKGY